MVKKSLKLGIIGVAVLAIALGIGIGINHKRRNSASSSSSLAIGSNADYRAYDDIDCKESRRVLVVPGTEEYNNDGRVKRRMFRKLGTESTINDSSISTAKALKSSLSMLSTSTSKTKSGKSKSKSPSKASKAKVSVICDNYLTRFLSYMRLMILSLYKSITTSIEL